MPSTAATQKLDTVRRFVPDPSRAAVSSYGFDFASPAEHRAVLHCSRCDAFASVIDGGIAMCGDCYLVEAVRREAIASPADRAQRAAAALEALRRILDEAAEPVRIDAARGEARTSGAAR